MNMRGSTIRYAVGPAVGSGEDRLKPSAFLQAAHVELERGADAIREQPRPIRDKCVEVVPRRIVNRARRIQALEGGGELFDSMETDRALVVPAHSAADIEALEIL